MERFLQFLIAGLSTGSLYALVALGLVLLYRCTRVLNFAHGELATLGTYLTYTLARSGHAFPLAAAGGLLSAALIAVVFYLGVLAPAQRRGATHFSMLILTLGLAQVLNGLVLWGWSAEPERLPLPISDRASLALGPALVSPLSLAALGAGLAGSLLLFLGVQKTRFGLALRAISENLPAAQSLGLPTRAVLALAWGLASALAGLAGLFLAARVFLDPFFMLDPFLKGLAAATLGGLSSLPGALLGGLLLGVAESLAGGYLSIEFKNTVAFLVILVVLLVRPDGILGRGFKERV